MSNKKSIDTIKASEPKLSAEEILFSRLMAKGYSMSRAYRLSHPAKKHLSYSRIRRLASELAAKQHIQTEVEVSKEKSARLARLSEDRIEEVLTDGDIDSKNSRVADVAMFMYEQSNGKAVQKTEVIGRHLMVQYDLSGGKAGEVPQEVLDQLKDD